MKDEQLIKEQAREQFLSLHQQWLQNPVTNTYLKALRAHKEGFVNNLSNSAASKDTTDQQLRWHAISVRDFDVCIKILQDPNVILNIVENSKIKET